VAVGMKQLHLLGEERHQFRENVDEEGQWFTNLTKYGIYSRINTI